MNDKLLRRMAFYTPVCLELIALVLWGPNHLISHCILVLGAAFYCSQMAAGIWEMPISLRNRLIGMGGSAMLFLEAVAVVADLSFQWAALWLVVALCCFSPAGREERELQYQKENV